MDDSVNLAFQFEPALIKEIEEFGGLRSYKDGDIIMDYGKYIRVLPLVVKGTLKVLKKTTTGMRPYCLIYQAARADQWLTVVA